MRNPFKKKKKTLEVDRHEHDFYLDESHKSAYTIALNNMNNNNNDDDKFHRDNKLELCINIRRDFGPGKKIVGIFFGCAGTLSFRQKQIGRSVKKDPEAKIIIHMGDNVYQKGIEEKDDPMEIIRKYYTEPYQTNVGTRHNSYVAAGNHDYGYKEPAYSTVMKQVDYYYSKKNPDKHDTTWIMPYRYYILYDEESKAVFIVLDSNVFLWDQVQINWFIKHYEIFDTLKYKKFLVMHHPALTFGKRMLEDENLLKHWSDFYKGRQAKFENTDIMIDPTQSVGFQIFQLLTQHKKTVKAVFAAHDHFPDARLLSSVAKNGKDDLDKNKKTHQFTSGSAGADKKYQAAYQFTSDARVWLGSKFMTGEVVARRDIKEETINNAVKGSEASTQDEKQEKFKTKLSIVSDAYLRINEKLNPKNAYFKMHLTSTYCYVDAIEAQTNWLLYRFLIPFTENTEQIMKLRNIEKIINLILETLTDLKIRAGFWIEIGGVVEMERKELYTKKIQQIENLVNGFSILKNDSGFTHKKLKQSAYKMFNKRTNNLEQEGETTSAQYFRKLCETFDEPILPF